MLLRFGRLTAPDAQGRMDAWNERQVDMMMLSGD